MCTRTIVNVLGFFLLKCCYISECVHCWVSVCCVSVCVHWGWGMWVGKILKMESFLVGAGLWLNSWGRWSNTPHFTQSLFPGVERTSHLSNQQVNHCGAAVHQSTETWLQTALSPHHPQSHTQEKKMYHCFYSANFTFSFFPSFV